MIGRTARPHALARALVALAIFLLATLGSAQDGPRWTTNEVRTIMAIDMDGLLSTCPPRENEPGELPACFLLTSTNTTLAKVLLEMFVERMSDVRWYGAWQGDLDLMGRYAMIDNRSGTRDRLGILVQRVTYIDTRVWIVSDPE